MALNKKIMEKLVQETKDDLAMQNFLNEIFQLEGSNNLGWYTKPYEAIVKKYCGKEGQE